MSVELPLAPVDSIIREADPDIRVSSSASEELAKRIQVKGAEMAMDASRRATQDGRKTIMPSDLDIDMEPPNRNSLLLPVAPVDRIARLEIDDYRVSQDARVLLAGFLENWAMDVARSSADLARHADRKTVQSEDIQIYFDVCVDS